VIAVLGPAMVLCVVGARIWSGTVSAVLLAVVSGALWGVFAVLTKGVVERLDGGLLALLRTPELYVWVLVAIAGTAWQQSSFRAGALTGIAADHDRCGCGDGGRDGRSGPRRGGRCHQATRVSTSLGAC